MSHVSNCQDACTLLDAVLEIGGGVAFETDGQNPTRRRTSARLEEVVAKKIDARRWFVNNATNLLPSLQ